MSNLVWHRQWVAKPCETASLAVKYPANEALDPPRELSQALMSPSQAHLRMLLGQIGSSGFFNGG